MNFLGPILALGLAAVGSSIGCALAGTTSHGYLSRTDENHGLVLGLSAMPASQTIYGFVIMIMLSGSNIDTIGSIAIGFCVGVGLMVSAIFQGKACSSAILAIAKKSSISGKVFLAPGIIESFALFSLIGGIVLSSS
jgi:V/A-type H+-transporting ATPase subunit K